MIKLSLVLYCQWLHKYLIKHDSTIQHRLSIPNTWEIVQPWIYPVYLTVFYWPGYLVIVPSLRTGFYQHVMLLDYTLISNEFLAPIKLVNWKRRVKSASEAGLSRNNYCQQKSSVYESLRLCDRRTDIGSMLPEKLQIDSIWYRNNSLFQLRSIY